jgi:hypothetical protein
MIRPITTVIVNNANKIRINFTFFGLIFLPIFRIYFPNNK